MTLKPVVRPPESQYPGEGQLLQGMKGIRTYAVLRGSLYD